VVASPVDDRHLAYVAMSRHREQAKLHWATDDFKPMTLVADLSRSRAKEATTDCKVDVDAFLERRGFESRRNMSEVYTAYDEQATAWISAHRERLEATRQRFEALIGRRQAAAVIEPLIAATATALGSDHTVTVSGRGREVVARLTGCS
jgi:hypothetical protein